MESTVGVLGAGSFGAVVANLLGHNNTVYLYTRRQHVVDEILSKGEIRGIKMSPNIIPTTDISLLAKECKLIFPVVRSAHFREMMRGISHLLTPEHILIHGTKGLDILHAKESEISRKTKFSRDEIRTMSEVILEESVVKRVGCFSGPNLAKEIAEGQIAGAVIASRFDEVVELGRKALESSVFRVYTSDDITGVELTGALKNIMALASGALKGLGYGENAKSMLISRGLAELTWIGTTLGGQTKAFLGIAGIGDLVATCSSPNSRNFSVGFRVAQGEKLSDILAGMNDVVEGIDTVKIIHSLINFYGVRAPITQTLFKILFEDMPIDEGIDFLMKYPALKDVDFI
jgi:glycerol-3-phosphate dehydrogenase (NAD(P)+)